jgi:DNA-binding LytR/AlgR family response regulator
MGVLIVAASKTDSNSITIVIAEDEVSVLQLLQAYLASFPQISIVGTANNGTEAISLIDQLLPVAVFLDVQMPEMDGLSTAVHLKEKHPDMLVVFVTGHIQYAADAYQLDAVDYLIKPLTRDAVARTIRKIERSLARSINNGATQATGRIIVKNNHEIFFVDLQNIIFVEKQLRKAVIHTDHGEYTTTETLSSLEKKLDSNFFRCHNSFIINLKKIEKIYPIAERVYAITFQDCKETVSMGRQKFEELSGIIAEIF